MEKKSRRYPIWNAKTITLISVLVIGLTSIMVFLFGKRPIFEELQLTLLIVSISLFIFLSIGLFYGVRIKNQPIIDQGWSPLKSDDILSTGLPDVDLPDLGGGIAETIISIVLWILISIVLLLVLTLLANILWIVIFVLAFIVYWIFYRALRLVFAKSRFCKGNLLRSLQYSLFYTVLYTGWVYGLVMISKQLI